ncbi:hypothetical protein niasHT_028068 [Heterodera trifolii]|uniref:Uncharacterized protein n=1 Tax=Heterodera trifolii TaxID=157864 RepID=A0ABD2KEE9_9BILA
MPEKPSKTSDHQRLEEMLCHLTPHGAAVPYNVCFDSDHCLWVASKGGLFKFVVGSSGNQSKLVFHFKNEFPRKMAPYTQVLYFNSKIIYVCAEEKSDLSVFRIFSLDGTNEHEHIIDGKVQSVAISQNGDLYMTKQPTHGTEESAIWRSHIDHPMAWEEFCSTFDECFQSLCVYDNDTIAVAVVSSPVNLYSKQCIKWVATNDCRIIGSFSTSGKDNGQIFFPRCLQKHGDSLLILDKTGRIQKFTREGHFVEISAKIDDYIGNGFTIREDEAVVACSGIVKDEEGKTVCDDWVENIRLDGSRWTAET